MFLLSLHVPLIVSYLSATAELSSDYFYNSSSFIWGHARLRWACLEMSIALQKHSHSSVCTSRTQRHAGAGLLNNLKWNNSVRRAQTRVGVRACVPASARGVKAPEVFLTSRNVNNSPSTVHINFQTAGRRERAEEPQEEEGRGWRVNDGERASTAFFWQMKAQKLLYGVKITFHPGF